MNFVNSLQKHNILVFKLTNKINLELWYATKSYAFHNYSYIYMYEILTLPLSKMGTNISLVIQNSHRQVQILIVKIKCMCSL